MELAVDCANQPTSEQERFELLRQVILEYDRKESNLIQILHMAQAIFGYLPDPVLQFIGEEMDLPMSHDQRRRLFLFLFCHPAQRTAYRSRSAWARPAMSAAARKSWMP